jgi:hypothetical protein
MGTIWLMSTCLGMAGIEPVADVDVAVLLRRMAERAREVAKDTNLPIVVYKNLSYFETLDASGAVRRTKEKLYQVTLRRGMTHNRLVAIDGRPLTAGESEVQSEKEKRWRDTYAGAKGGSMAERMDALVNERLLSRFEFTVAGRDSVRDRPCWVLDFKPRTGDLPEDRLIDRVINLLHGRVWVSMEEHEIVRADVKTEGGLKLWGGVLGSLETFQLHLDRDRSQLGVWYPRHAEVTVRARRLFSPMHVRLREISSDVQRWLEPVP